MWWMSIQIFPVPLFTVLLMGFMIRTDMLICHVPSTSTQKMKSVMLSLVCCPCCWNTPDPYAKTRLLCIKLPVSRSNPYMHCHLFFGKASRTSWKRPWPGPGSWLPHAGEPRMEQNLYEFPLKIVFLGSHFSAEQVKCRPLDCELSRLLVCNRRPDNPQANPLPNTWVLNMTSSEEQQVFQE